MKVIICGAGQVGYGIAERLASEGNDVTVIDRSPQLVSRVQDHLDARGIVGHGSHPDILSAAGAADADMLVAVTLYDEVNMVACQQAHSIFKVPTKIARIRDQSYLAPEFADIFSRENMPIDVVISPEVEVGETVLRRIAIPGATDVVQFANDNVSMLEIECNSDCPVIDTPLDTLSELFPDLNAVVVGILRDGKLIVPHSDSEMKSGDLAYIVVRSDNVRRSLSVFGHQEPDATRIILIGGGSIGTYVASKIISSTSNIQMNIIESSPERAESIAESLDKSVVVINGSALDQDILKEAGVAQADLAIALTNDDQVNILTSVMMKRLGCESNLALLNNKSYYDFTKTLGIDAHINPRTVTMSKILQHVRRGRILKVHSIQNGIAEILEAEALETSPLVGVPLRELGLPEGTRIGAIYRDDEVLIPEGQLVVKANDRIVIFASSECVKQVEQMFRVSLDYF